MVSEQELKQLGLIGLKTLLHISFWDYMFIDLGVVKGRVEHYLKITTKKTHYFASSMSGPRMLVHRYPIISLITYEYVYK